jgi:hypothetical protein
MSIRKAYINKDINKYIFINEYNEELHKNKIYCYLGHELIAKKGTKKIHHFCHKNKEISCCDRYNKMSEWHCYMQNRINTKNLEISVKNYDINNKLKLHIADVITDDNIVIEFQKSVIDKSILYERDYFYNKYFKQLIWVFCIFRNDINIIDKYGDLICFNINKGSNYFLYCGSKSYLDQGKNGLIEILYKNKTNKTNKKKSHNYNYIIGRYISFKQFDNLYLKNCLLSNCDNRIERPVYKYDFITTKQQQKDFISKYIPNYKIHS